MNASAPPSSIDDGLRFCPALCRNAPAGRDAPRQRHAFDAWVVDDVVGLLVRDQKIGVQTDGRAGVDPEFLEGDGALRHAAGMLDHQNIARHQMRTRDARKLVVGEVPWLDAEDHPDRAALHMALAQGRMQFFIRKEALGILGVVGEDLGAELHLAARLVDALAHLQRHDVGQRPRPFHARERRLWRR